MAIVSLHPGFLIVLAFPEFFRLHDCRGNLNNMSNAVLRLRLVLLYHRTRNAVLASSSTVVVVRDTLTCY